ncbi:MAG: hypothetical protein JWL83_4461 [Actinomycetia bacterium]|nr:hypothetical protein [Actinomycetes bacterium]
MRAYSAKIEAHVAGALDAGERVLAATPAAPKGAMQSMVRADGPTGLSFPGCLWGARSGSRHLAPGRDELTLLGVPYAPQFVLALTDRRFLWCSTTVTGRPKKVLATLPRGVVDALVLSGAQLLGTRFGLLRFDLRDGRCATFEVAPVHLGRAREFAAAFRPPAGA